MIIFDQTNLIRFTVYQFLEQYLNPPKPFQSASEMRKAAYGFN